MDSTVPLLPDGPTSDRVVYANQMAQVRNRIAEVRWLLQMIAQLGTDHVSLQEAIFVQFRKITELIAFASLVAHKDAYAAAHANFRRHWRAKEMLAAVEKLNPNFYPQAMLEPVANGPNAWHVPGFRSDGLKRDEFELIYDRSSELLHATNPYSEKDATVQIVHSVGEWANRFERLLEWHSVQLLDGTRWIAHVPREGKVHLYPLAPAPADG
jgi:hypothetical protein